MENDKNLQDLIDWKLCERNNDGGVKPTSDFLVWYYGYLVHVVVQSYGEIVHPDNEEMDKEREEFIKDCIRDQIVMWIAQKIGKKEVIQNVNDKHVKIIYDLINDIDHRLMCVHELKLGRKRSD